MNTTTTGDEYTDTFAYDVLERVTVQTTSVGASRTRITVEPLQRRGGHSQQQDELRCVRRAVRRSLERGSTAPAMATILLYEDERFARGYTDHEQLNRTGFIHMNGWVYNPVPGRQSSASRNWDKDDRPDNRLSVPQIHSSPQLGVL